MRVMTVAQEASRVAMSPTVSRAAEQLFHEHSGWLYGYCLRLLRSPEEAEDAVRATYLNACRSLRQGTRPRAGSAWLLHIARNVCFTRIRSARRREGVERIGDITVLEETVAAPDHSYDSLLGLTDALLTLPERQRGAILPPRMAGDVARRDRRAAMGITHSAAETLMIFRARRSLAEALENPGKRSRFKALHVLDLGALLAPSRASSPRARARRRPRPSLSPPSPPSRWWGPPRFLGLGREPVAAQAEATQATRASAASFAAAATAAGFSTAPLQAARIGPRLTDRTGRAWAERRLREAEANGPNENANGNANSPREREGTRPGERAPDTHAPADGAGRGTP